MVLQILDESDQDLDAALLAFEAKRHPETLALHQLDMISGTWWGLPHLPMLSLQHTSRPHLAAQQCCTHRPQPKIMLQDTLGACVQT